MFRRELQQGEVRCTLSFSASDLARSSAPARASTIPPMSVRWAGTLRPPYCFASVSISFCSTGCLLPAVHTAGVGASVDVPDRCRCSPLPSLSSPDQGFVVALCCCLQEITVRPVLVTSSQQGV
jgi:hypothetical protein